MPDDYAKILVIEKVFVPIHVGGVQGLVNPVETVDFNTTLGDPAHLKGRTFWNGVKNAISYYNEIADVAVNLGQEVLFPVYNGSGADILNGRVVTPDPTGITLADSHHKHKSRLIAVATHDITAGTWGYVTRLGQVGGLNTSAYTAGQILYLGSSGLYAIAPPLDGGYSIIVGVVDVVHATAGVITVDTHVSDLTVEVTDTNGFPLDQKANTSLSVDDGTRTFTIDVVAGNEYHFYERGDKYEKEDAETTQAVVFDDLEGEHWFYFADGIFTVMHEPTTAQKEYIILNNAFVATIYWNATDKKIEIDILEERHGISIPPASHLYLHITRSAQYVSGLGLSNFTVDGDGSLDAHAQLEAAGGVYFDEDITHAISAAGFPATIPVVYNLGSLRNVRSESQAGFPILNAPAGRPYYNEFTGATWQLTEVPNNQFCLYHVFAVNGVSVGFISIMGQTSHATRNGARNAAATEISSISANLPFAEFVPLGTFIIQVNDGYANAVKAKIVSTGDGDYVDWRTTELAQGVAPSSHLNLSNLELAAAGVTWGHVDDQAQTIMGVKTFGSLPVGPSAAPTDDYQLANKKYVDDSSGGGGGAVEFIASFAATGVESSVLFSGLADGYYRYIIDFPSATAVKISALFNGDATVDANYSSASILTASTGGAAYAASTSLITPVMSTSWTQSFHFGDIRAIGGNILVNGKSTITGRTSTLGVYPSEIGVKRSGLAVISDIEFRGTGVFPVGTKFKLYKMQEA